MHALSDWQVYLQYSNRRQLWPMSSFYVQYIFISWAGQQLCTGELASCRAGRSVSCFQEHLIGASQLVCCPPGTVPAATGRRMGGRNKVKKSIWQLLCGCSSPQTKDWSIQSSQRMTVPCYERRVTVKSTSTQVKSTSRTLLITLHSLSLSASHAS